MHRIPQSLACMYLNFSSYIAGLSFKLKPDLVFSDVAKRLKQRQTLQSCWTAHDPVALYMLISVVLWAFSAFLRGNNLGST